MNENEKARRLQELLRRASQDICFFADNLLIDPDRADEKAKFKTKFVQRRTLTSKKKYVWICAARRSGKSLGGQCKVIHPITLKPTPISELIGTDKTLTFDFKRNEVIWSDCEWIESGFKQCLKLDFGTGVELFPSTDHLIFHQKKGWIPASELKIGDKVLAPTIIPIFGDLVPTEEEVELRGKQASTDKIIHESVFSYNKESLQEFLKTLWFQDGRMLHGERTAVFFLWSREICLDLHHLLLRFGIESRIDEDGNLFVETEIDLKVFLDLMGIEVLITEIRPNRRWEVIKDIRKIGERMTYDMSVLHFDANYIASDVVVHNSFSMIIKVLHYLIFNKNKTILFFSPSATQVEVFFDSLKKFIRANEWIWEKVNGVLGNHKQPHHRITFDNGCFIAGFPMGIHANLEDGRRGLGGDLIIVDEAQDLKDEDWAVIDPMITAVFKPHVQAFISGTIKVPSGRFYETCMKKGRKLENGEWYLNEHEDLIYLPITENPDFTEEIIESIRAVTPLYSWNTEYLLQVSEGEKSVFRTEDILDACKVDWEYGPKNIDMNPRFDPNYLWEPMEGTMERYIGVDWDKVQAGTNIAVVQYNTATKEMSTIYRKEVNHREFTYVAACDLVTRLYAEYSPRLIVCDKGQGDQNHEILKLFSRAGGTDLERHLQFLHFNTPLILPELNKPGETQKKQAKNFLVTQLQLKLQEKKWFFPTRDEELKNQLLTYEVKSGEPGKYKFTSKFEHIIDCHLFCLYGIWKIHENVYDSSDKAANTILNISRDKLVEVADPDIRQLWSQLEKEREQLKGIGVYRTPLGGNKLERRFGTERRTW